MYISIGPVAKRRVFFVLFWEGEGSLRTPHIAVSIDHFTLKQVYRQQGEQFLFFFFIEFCALNKYSPGIRIDNIVYIRSFPSSASTYVGVMIGSDS